MTNKFDRFDYEEQRLAELQEDYEEFIAELGTHDCVCGVPIPDDVEQELCSDCDAKANVDYKEPEMSAGAKAMLERLRAKLHEGGY